jgi:hypothetical protein
MNNEARALGRSVGHKLHSKHEASSTPKQKGRLGLCDATVIHTRQQRLLKERGTARLLAEPDR